MDTTIDCLISFPDAKVSTLCIGGSAMYTAKQKCSIDENLVLQCSGSSISTLCPRQVSLVLVSSLIWAAHNEEMSSIMHTDIVERIKSNIYNTIRLIENNLNPI